MNSPDPSARTPRPAEGFALPAVLVVVGALLILAVGLLFIIGIERDTARSFADRQRADLAARAGLEEIRGILGLETANDEFIVVQDQRDRSAADRQDPPGYLYIARPSAESGYRYTPLFSHESKMGAPADPMTLAAPDSAEILGDKPEGLVTLPWKAPAKVDWIELENGEGKVVSRYAYWVEDLQGRVDAGTAGNKQDGGKHLRYGWKAGDPSNHARFPAPGLNAEDSDPSATGRDGKPPLNQVALFTLDPASGAADRSTLDDSIIDSHALLISPNSVLAAAGISPPLTRDAEGHLENPAARAVEENLTAEVQPYDEQPLVPHARGIDPAVAGEPKLNLNALLAKPPKTAVDEMAAWIKKGLPRFEDRKGGFPDDYLKTLAANAIDYADADSDGTTAGSIMGSSAYRGLDAYPLMSEVILHIKYTGVTTNVRKALSWQMIVYVELWNHTNLPVSGMARVSYENGMKPPAIGVGVSGGRFDDPALMDDPDQVSPKLDRIDGRYWTPPFSVNLQPNQYKFYRAATIEYKLDVGSLATKLQSKFEIYEDPGSAGISMMWNGTEVDRSDKLVRGNSSATDPELEYITNFKKQSGKANIPGHSYGFYNTFNDYKNNMGDPRQALYLRGQAYPLSDNSYPGNVSPNRRNVRNVSIYQNAKPDKTSLVYGRVLPSEWPDGGHDSDVNGLPTSYPPVNDYDPTTYPDYLSSREGEAPTFISNRGRFYSATELGRIFDPVMYLPTYDSPTDTASIRRGTMPASQVSWPSIPLAAVPDIYYGGGNTLRIGRPEHPRFDQPSKHLPLQMPGTHAARLLDLFHAGKSRSPDAEDREGPVVRIEGHVNLNTATPDALRAIAGGLLTADPRLAKRISEVHSTATFAPPVSPLEVSAPTRTKEADLVAEAIIRGRPYDSPSEVASVLDSGGRLLLGNRDLLPDGNKVQWSDAAAEEVFARIYNSTTVRSRNFRVWVIGQALAPVKATSASREVLSEVRKAYTVFADPGKREADGSIDPQEFKLTIIDENSF